MGVVAEAPIREERAGGRDVTRKQIRGSSLLLLGRGLSMGINFAAQVLVVRYLSTRDYGAWAYALSVVAFCQGFATLGLDRAVTRFIPIYHEKREYDRLFGTIFMVIGSILLTGLVVIAVFYAFPDQITRLINDKQQPLVLLFVMIFLVPVEALDGLLIGLFASLGSPRAIFFRRYVLAPGLKLLVVILLILRKSEVVFLAKGYLAASVFGVVIYSWILLRLLRHKGLLGHFHLGQVRVPAREILAFTIPLMTSDLLTVVMHSADTLLLGHFCNLHQVAFFRVVMPAALLNRMVMNSFALLFTPAAARLFAREDYGGINELYWRTAVWMTVLSFPIFALTFSVAKPLTVALYGARYEQSAVILALLSLGFYFDVALGLNGLTLKVLGKLRYMVMINLGAAIANVAVNLLLIPRYGALGAAIGTTATVIVYNILKQTGLRLASGISLFEKKYFTFYMTIVLSAAGLLVLRSLTPDNIYVAVALVALASLIVVTLGKKNLKVAETFPELAKLPLMRVLFS